MGISESLTKYLEDEGVWLLSSWSEMLMLDEVLEGGAGVIGTDKEGADDLMR